MRSRGNEANGLKCFGIAVRPVETGFLGHIVPWISPLLRIDVSESSSTAALGGGASKPSTRESSEAEEDRRPVLDADEGRRLALLYRAA